MRYSYKSMWQRHKSQLFHLFQNSHNEVSVNYHIDIVETICEGDWKKFRNNPSQYLDGLNQFLQKQLIQKVMNPALTQGEKFEAAKRLENTYYYFESIPYTSRVYKKFSEINSSDVGQWIVVTGTVIQATSKKTLEKSKIFECTGCGSEHRIRSTYHNGYRFQMPEECGVMKEKKSKSLDTLGQFMKKEKCRHGKFEPSDKWKICIDYQELRMQEQFTYIQSGKIPHTISVLLEGDMANASFRPGDDLTVTGILSYRYKKLQKERQIQPQLILYANNIVLQKTQNIQQNDPNEQETQKSNESQFKKLYASFPLNLYSEYNLSEKERVIVKQLQFRKDIITEFCPMIYGRNVVKLGLLLSLLGGVSVENENSKIRGQSHVLLVGEPGTGKSVLLKQIAKLSDRSFLTNGIGTTSAGLSVSYYKDGGEWMIEAGALVLADNGVCCIDQLTLLSKKDEKSLLEAMEQQTISSAKASLIGKLNARATLICACNPVRLGQKYDPQLSLQLNTGLSIPLLTRFDMVFIMKDEKSVEEDFEKCDHILSKFMNDPNELGVGKKKTPDSLNLKVLLKKCQSYSPELCNHEIFSQYFTEERRRDSKVKTARAFQSLCRIAEAHAKLMLRESTTLLDCITAIMLTQNQYISTIEEYYAYLDQFNSKYHTNLS